MKIDKELVRELSDSGLSWEEVAEEYNGLKEDNKKPNSLRANYSRHKDDLLLDVELKDFEQIALREMKLMSDRKMLQRQQSAISSQLRYNADKDLVAEVFNNHDRMGFIPVDLKIKEINKNKHCPIYNISDLHMGYFEEGYYDLEQAKENLTNFFRYVNKEISDNELKEVIISDTGDMIEGSTLRASQLFTIAKVMTEQATIYADMFTSLLKELSRQHPQTKINVYLVDEDNHSQIRLAGASRGDTTEQVSKVIANDIRRTVETAHEYGGMLNVNFEHAGEIFANVNGKEVMFTHGHQYARDSKQLVNKVFAIHGKIPDVIIRGHYHTYLHESRNVVNDFMQVTITAPSAVGDTRYGREGLGLTGLSGAMKIKVGEHTAVSEFVKL